MMKKMSKTEVRKKIGDASEKCRKVALNPAVMNLSPADQKKLTQIINSLNSIYFKL